MRAAATCRLAHFHAGFHQKRHFHAATVAVALSPAQRQLPLLLTLPLPLPSHLTLLLPLPLHLTLLLTWIPVDDATSLVPKSDKEASAV
jgi:hypothetical protein